VSTTRPVTSPSHLALVEPGERLPLFAAAGAYFCLLSGYYVLRSLREAMALEAGRANLPLLFTTTFVVMLAILPLYWWLVGRVPRRRLLGTIYVPAAALFAVLAAGAAARGTVAPWMAGVYFVAVTSLNLFLVSVFWSVMADSWSPGAAQRLFGYIAGGGSAGALAGPAFNALFVERLGSTTVVLVACTLLVAAVALGRLVQRPTASGEARVADHAGGAGEARIAGGAKAAGEASTADPDAAVGGRAGTDLSRLVHSPYLLGIAGLIVAGQILGAFTYNEQAKYVESAYAVLETRAALFARIDFAVNVVALALQWLVVGRLTKSAGLRTSLPLATLLTAASFLLVAIVPTGPMLLATQVVRRAGDYGLFKPTREMLFTVLEPESKFKSKSLIDTVLQRGADSLGNWLYQPLAVLGLAGLAWMSAAACVLLTFAARRLAAAFEDRERHGI